MGEGQNNLPDPFNPSPEELKALYERMKNEFTLEDLKAFDVEEKDIVPFSRLLEELDDLVQRSKGKSE